MAQGQKYGCLFICLVISLLSYNNHTIFIPEVFCDSSLRSSDNRYSVVIHELRDHKYSVAHLEIILFLWHYGDQSTLTLLWHTWRSSDNWLSLNHATTIIFGHSWRSIHFIYSMAPPGEQVITGVLWMSMNHATRIILWLLLRINRFQLFCGTHGDHQLQLFSDSPCGSSDNSCP